MGTSVTAVVGTGSDAKCYEFPKHNKLADRTQQIMALFGPGLYPLGGNTTIGGITKSNKEWNAEVIIGTGKTIKVRDFAAWIKGVEVGDKNIAQFEPNQTINYTVQGSGTVYIVITVTKWTSLDDGLERPDNARGIIGERTTPPTKDDPEILISKLTNVPVSGTITLAMIDNTVRDYLDKIDEMKKQIEELTTQAYEYLYNLIVTSVATLRTEIANGDQALATEINARCTTLQNQINQHTLDISELQTALATFSEWVTVSINNLQSQSQNLQNAVVDLQNAVQENDAFIQQVYEQVQTLAGSLTALMTRVDLAEQRLTSAENEIDYIKNTQIVNLYQYVVNEFTNVRTEIAQGDQTVYNNLTIQIATLQTDINTALSALQTQIEQNINTAIAQLQIDIAAMGDLIFNQIQPIVNQLSIDLANAVSNLSTLISGNTQAINDLIQRLGLDESYITALQIDVNEHEGRIATLENRPILPDWLLTQQAQDEVRLAQSENDIAALKLGVMQLGYNVLDSDINTGGSSYLGLLAVSGLTLFKTTEPAIIFSDDFTRLDGAIDLAKWKIIRGIPQIKNNQLFFPFFGGGSAVASKTALAMNFELTFDAKVTTDLNIISQLVVASFRSSTQQASPSVSGTTQYEMVGNISMNSSIITSGGVWIDKIVNGARYNIVSVSASVFNGLPRNSVLHFKLVANGNNIKIYENGTLVLDYTDVNGGGKPPILTVGYLNFLTYYWDLEMYYDNVVYKDLDTLGYNVSGTILTNLLQSIDPIASFIFEAIDTIPINTTLTYDVSLDNGAHWIIGLVSGQLVDGMIAPWNGVAHQPMIRANLATTNGVYSPIIAKIRIITANGVNAEKFLVVKAKVNEIIEAINLGIEPL